MSEVTKRIDDTLKEIGMSKSEFYKAAGITSSAYSQWNTGKTEPKPATLRRATTILNVNYEWLIFGTGEKWSKKSPDTKPREKIPHGKMRQVWSEGGIRVYLDEDANVPQENLEDIIKYIKLRQRDVGR